MNRGSRAYHNGIAAEDIAARQYASLGGVELARRWKTKAGEIDLVFRLGGVIVFIEVKARKTHDIAAGAITASQQQRLLNCAHEYLAQYADLNADCRFDLAMVDGQGQCAVLENIFG